MLLRNYYTSLTRSSVGTSNVTEDVSKELSPRYSRTITGAYKTLPFIPEFISTEVIPAFKYGAWHTSSQTNRRLIYFGNNTANVTFNDYAPTGEYVAEIDSVRKTATTTYDENTKTYTSVETFTLTNNNNYNLPINEILLAVTPPSGAYAQYAYVRELLGENSFTLNSKESVNFELTIKYTIAEPLQ